MRVAHVVSSVEQLRQVIPAPSPVAQRKVSNVLDSHARQVIAESPLVFVSTSDRLFNIDVSPKGDLPGFVRVEDPSTLLIPERPGNRLADSLRNVLANPHVGLLFIVPGATDTLRVNGRATITTDAALLTPSAMEGKVPRLGVLVDIDEAYTQCSKAFLRSRLWDPRRFVDPDSMPTGGQVHRAIQGEQFDADEYDRERAERYRQRVGFY